jgi:hypothetical protein
MSEKSSLMLHQEMNFKWGKRSYTECCTRKAQRETRRLLDGVWMLKGIKKKADAGDAHCV